MHGHAPPSHSSVSAVAAPTAAPASAASPPLYRPEQEHDGCGVGFVATLSGSPTHEVLELALQGLANLTHRGAVSADARTGDGAGVLFQIPLGFFARDAARLGCGRVPTEDLAVGMAFLPRAEEEARRCRARLESAAHARGLNPIGWRRVPVLPEALGSQAQATCPRIEQLLLRRSERVSAAEYERALYLARRETERWALEEAAELYVASLSHRTLVYKGLLSAPQLPRFYEDLSNPLFETRFAILHQRYSTNTFPNWVLAQPFRMLAHNGEINTLQGNRNWMRAREPELRSALWGEEIARLTPVVQPGGSDSASLDNVLELLVLSGRDPLHAMAMLVPEAWENMPDMPLELRQFYEYHACLSEPWDGPAALAFSDGRLVGAVLDRNGLRPARYTVTSDGLVVLGSEAGMVPLESRSAVRKGRLGPGQMFAVDTESGQLLTNREIKRRLAGRQAYGSWLLANLAPAGGRAAPGGMTRPGQPNGRPVPSPALPDASTPDLERRQVLFGYTREELALVLEPMARSGAEAVGSMGDDTALAVLGERPRLLYHYLKQKFAQVTNPPIDSLRERLVMSLDVFLGRRGSLLDESPAHARLAHLSGPILRNEELESLKRLPEGGRAAVLHVTFDKDEGPEGLEPAIARICAEAETAVEEGASLLVLSDRLAGEKRVPVPMLAAIGAVHHGLIRCGRRMRASLVAETGEARDVHQFACLVGYGASAVNPYLAFETVADLARKGAFQETPPAEVLARYLGAAEDGLLKIMSKMGISTLSAYQGAQIFEALGLGRGVTERCFVGTPSRVGGVGFREIGEDVCARHRRAYGSAEHHPDAPEERAALEEGSFFRFRRDGEAHAFSPAVAKALRRASESGSREDYEAYRALSERTRPMALRDLLRFRRTQPPVELEEVEPIESIMARFAGGAMSLGALSPETHETIAIAMNRLGGKSNTGEGGEDPQRFQAEDPRMNANSAIKQVASGRFGVTPAYLAAAAELEIKMAQGSKPGEGGQLPGHKVSVYIATLRHTLPGTTLVSPPPHHDIYSIEDLAQLIYDLKQANPRARVSVKLVAEEGVGTIAAGVAKGYADVIHIAGHEGGTGASPLSSIKNAGLPWELGLAETQQVLVFNDLRERVRLRTDGGLKSGRDVLVAALLGAEEYAFGTAALIALGCKMARQCHLNTCPVGITTQREDLRAKFRGAPHHLYNFAVHVAYEVRELLAALGFRSLNEIIGRMDLLEPDECARDGRAAALDPTAMLWVPADDRPLHSSLGRNLSPAASFDDELLAGVRLALDRGAPFRVSRRVRNVHRSVGTRISGEVAARTGGAPLPPGTIELHLKGAAGQSLGAFCAAGVRILLCGEANDYVGKGMAGGEIAIRPPARGAYVAGENVIAGNTVLYGATGGELFLAGRAGERFAVRNSGARAVVEGVGDHACEYMTQGVVVVLGGTGRNFAPAMSNGVAYVFDEHAEFADHVLDPAVGLERVASAVDVELLLALVRRHVQLTGSRLGRDVLSRWDHFRPRFWKVAPREALAGDAGAELVRRHLEELQPASAECVGAGG